MQSLEGERGEPLVHTLRPCVNVLNNDADDLSQGHSVRDANQIDGGGSVPNAQHFTAATSSPVGVEFGFFASQESLARALTACVATAARPGASG